MSKFRKNKRQAFTLIELLAVIVILAIILVVAIPKVLDVIELNRKNSMENAAKIIAGDVESKYSSAMVVGDVFNTSGDCITALNLDTTVYGTCSYTIDTNGKSKITLTGTDGGKFDGYTCTDATKLEATCIKDGDEEETVSSCDGKTVSECITYLYNDGDNEKGLVADSHTLDYDHDSSTPNTTLTNIRYTGGEDVYGLTVTDATACKNYSSGLMTYMSGNYLATYSDVKDICDKKDYVESYSIDYFLTQSGVTDLDSIDFLTKTKVGTTTGLAVTDPDKCKNTTTGFITIGSGIGMGQEAVNTVCDGGTYYGYTFAQIISLIEDETDVSSVSAYSGEAQIDVYEYKVNDYDACMDSDDGIMTLSSYIDLGTAYELCTTNKYSTGRYTLTEILSNYDLLSSPDSLSYLTKITVGDEEIYVVNDEEACKDSETGLAAQFSDSYLSTSALPLCEGHKLGDQIYTYNEILDEVFDEYDEDDLPSFVGEGIADEGVHNYVTFNGETWRIIGIVDGYVKIMRNESLRDSAYRTYMEDSPYTIPDYYNLWSHSDIMYLLNGYYYDLDTRYGKYSDCLKYNPYENFNNENNTSCASTVSKLSVTAKDMIVNNQTWYFGDSTHDVEYIYDLYNALSDADDVYNNEHSTTAGNYCVGCSNFEDLSCTTCSEATKGDTTWTGAVGLINLSDILYGYDAEYRGANPISGTSYIPYNWIYKSDDNNCTQYTLSTEYMMSEDDSTGVGSVYMIYTCDYNGPVTFSEDISDEYGVYPVVYLKNEVKITGGEGTSTDPYTLIYTKSTGSSYTITFDGNGGTPSVSSMSVVVGSSYESLPTATKSGSAFAGWYTEASGGTKVESIDVPTSNTTLYAHYNEAITITYKRCDDESIIDTQTLAVGEMFGSYTPSSIPANYEYVNRCYDKACTNVVNITDIVQSNTPTTLYVQILGKEINITLNSNNGTIPTTTGWTNSNYNSTSVKTIRYNTEYGILPEPIRAGATFEGWYTDELYTTKVESTDIVTYTSSFMLYAKWNVSAFASDSWDTILNNINSGNTSRYNVGDTRCISLSNNTLIGSNNNGCTNNQFKIRLVNNSNYNCTLDSNTACGFVISFDEIIKYKEMNSTNTNEGGWKSSSMRTYINSTIYNALPSDLKNIVANTTVVSGGNAARYTTIDKLYLLSNHEIWTDSLSVNSNYDCGSTISEYDLGYNSTRQLDYYANNNVTTTSNYSIVAKYDGTNYLEWWLRSTPTLYSNNLLYAHNLFSTATSSGYAHNDTAISYNGVVPAFRIGTNYSVTLNAGSGAVIPTTDGWTNSSNNTSSTKVLTNGSAYGTLPIPTKSGYTFAGWYTDELYTTKVESTSTITNSNHMLYAKFVSIPDPVSFATDTWETIQKAVHENNTSLYSVGDTKTINLGILGTHTVRIANMSTSTECQSEGFSESACGFVLEFSDIITNNVMNSTETNVGGWEASEMRTYVNSTIYDAIKAVTGDIIADTTVVSGHGSASGETNNTTTDKVYLLSAHEVYSDGTSSKVSDSDSAYSNTRQLDYYAGQGVTTNYNSANAAIKQYNGTNSFWWLRSAYADESDSFFGTSVYAGSWNAVAAHYSYGVSVAFRFE